MTDILIIFAARIFVRYDESYWRAGSTSFEDAGEKLHFVAFVSGGCKRRLAGLAPVELMLYVIKVDCDSGGHAVNNAPDCNSVALAEICETEEGAKCIHYVGCDFLIQLLRLIVRGLSLRRPHIL